MQTRQFKVQGWCRNGKKGKEGKKKKKKKRKNMKMKKPACTACSQNGHDPSPKRSMNKQMLLVLWQYCRRKSYITSTGTAEGKAASHLPVLRQEKLHVYWYCSRKSDITSTHPLHNLSLQFAAVNEIPEDGI